MKAVTAEQMRSIERRAVQEGTSLQTLMAAAGKELATYIARHSEGQVLILAGPGNNGQDGVIAACRLAAEGFAVALYTYKRTNAGDFAGAAVKAEDDPGYEELRRLLLSSGIVVDALLGIGQSRPLDDQLNSVLRQVRENTPVSTLCLAVDVPTGVHAGTGAVEGEAFKADVTLAMGYLKCGLVLSPGASYAGKVIVAGVGIPAHLDGDVRTQVFNDSDVAALLPDRNTDSNKGSNGRLLLIGGSQDFQGAPALAAMAAYRIGAGLVEVAVPSSVQASVAAHTLEPIYLPLAEQEGTISTSAAPILTKALAKAKAASFGSGMGQSSGTLEVTKAFLRTVTEDSPIPAVIDADGLNALSRLGSWWGNTSNLVLTPHPGEMSRLTGLSVPEIQADRLSVARQFARAWNVVVVLKGAGTVIASPDGDAVVNPTGGPNLATAGTGDVLCGVIAGLLAQGMSPFDGAVCGAYIHGRAGDVLRTRYGNAGTIASDLLPILPLARQSLLVSDEEEV